MEAPTPKEQTETITIDQNNIKYSLHITSVGETLTFLLTLSSEHKNKIFVRKKCFKRNQRLRRKSNFFITFLPRVYRLFKSPFRNEKNIAGNSGKYCLY